MQKVFQNFRTGNIEIIEAPIPNVSDNDVLIHSSLSLISSGTEKMLIDFGKSNMISKAINQPEKVREVIDKIRTDGFLSTYETVKTKLDQLVPMGYSNCGVVLKVGRNVKNISPGDRVISNGSHGNFVKVSKNLCSKIPSNVTDESAVFTVIGSIALQGIRLAKPTLGETVLVVGLGIIGIITCLLYTSPSPRDRG